VNLKYVAQTATACQPQSMVVADEPALTPDETARRVKAAVIHVGAAFGHEAAFSDAGRRLGLDQWAFYFGARAGVLGPVDAEVVTAVCGFFSPSLVRPAWESALAAASPAELVAEDVRLCIAWARRHLGLLPRVDRLANLVSRVVAAADASARPLFAAWRALPDPAEGLPAAQVGLGLLRLREQRGAGHLLAVAAHGLTPLEAIVAGAGSAKAAANGWHPPYPPVTSETAQRLAAADRCTDALAGMPYRCLDHTERAELVALLRSAHQQTAR
jgi:helix-turn-helix protein